MNIFRMLPGAINRSRFGSELWGAVAIVLIVALAASLAAATGLHLRLVLVGGIVVVLGVITFLILERVRALSNRKLAGPALFATWAGLVVFFVTTALFISSVFANVPAPLQVWLTGSNALTRTEFPKDVLSKRVKFANDAVGSSTMHPLDKWKEWLVRGIPMVDGWDEQVLIVTSSEAFISNYESFDVLVETEPYIEIPEVLAFLVTPQDPTRTGDMYSPVYRQMSVVTKPRSSNATISLSNPNEGEELFLLLFCRHKRGDALPHRPDGFSFTLHVKHH